MEHIRAFAAMGIGRAVDHARRQGACNSSELVSGLTLYEMIYSDGRWRNT
jgi:hypothetical protein